jgi:hypothetical protein
MYASCHVMTVMMLSQLTCNLIRDFWRKMCQEIVCEWSRAWLAKPLYAALAVQSNFQEIIWGTG